MGEREPIRDREQYNYVVLTFEGDNRQVRLGWNDTTRNIHNGHMVCIGDRTYEIRRSGFSAIPDEEKYATLHAVEKPDPDPNSDIINLDSFIQETK
jgi:hypothetical protein